MKTDFNGITLTDEETTIQRVFELLSAEQHNHQLSFSILEKAIQNSLCVSAYDGVQLIGFIRIITDYNSVSVLLDAVVDPVYRSRGIGQKLFEFAQNHPRLRHTAKILWTHGGERFFTAMGYKQLPSTLFTKK
jgi:ribosomal protein S18 acetylase RimI-like enzyme